jgi:hypothetical protein
MFVYHEAHLRLADQDRERAMIQRALERAAREGGTQQPGLVRGGITSFARVLGRVGFAASSLFPGGTSGASPVAGPSGY